MNITTRLIVVIFVSVLGPLLLLTYYLRVELSNSILKEKEDKLFGLARQLDYYLVGTYDDILLKRGVMYASRDEKIRALNAELRAITDFVASGNPGVGVGYYHRALDAAITYGPSDTFQYFVGVTIGDFEGHRGYDVMNTGKPLVQKGLLVRGNILNCMWPIIRDGETIGYIWANETVDMVDQQLQPILNRAYMLILLCFLAIYASVVLTTRRLPEGIRRIQAGIEKLYNEPTYRLPEVKGELNSIVDTINELVGSVNFMKCYNKYIIEGIINGIMVVSVDGTITRTNQGFFRIFPELDDSILGCGYQNIKNNNIIEIIRHCLEKGSHVINEEFEVSGRILEIYSNDIIDESDVVIGIVVVFRDITLIKNYEKELKEKEMIGALGEMALGVVHEIKNPLTSVKGFTQLLRRSGITDPKQLKYLEIIDSDLNRVNRLLNEMLLYGGYHHLEPVSGDIIALLHEVIDKTKTEYPDLSVQFRLNGKKRSILVFDRFKLLQVFYNIIKNAVDAMKDTPAKLFVIIFREEDVSVQIDFVDNGQGIDSDSLEKIFNPFFTTKEGGTGFGLPICYKILENHGGSIQVSSRLGRYTRVRVILPRKTAEVKAM